MRVVPVLDLMHGRVVRGVGGDRRRYQPVVSHLTASADPPDVAAAFCDRLGLAELYLADLDAIAGAQPALATHCALRARGFRLWVDAGLRTSADARPLADAAVDVLVAGLETLRGPDELSQLCADLGGARVAFSLDLRNGEPLGDRTAWPADAAAIARCAVQGGVRRLIVLDLARVVMARGIGTEELCGQLARNHSHLEVVAGGGVRSLADLQRLRDCGVQAALVASALHDGQITRTDLDAL
jgi:phosphoribosylformimino-5-aminoimidazole carboxamide ribotide isomerase